MYRTDPDAPTALRTTLMRLVALAAILAAAALTACNTTEGAGKDVKSLGKGIEESAHNNK